MNGAPDYLGRPAGWLFVRLVGTNGGLFRERVPVRRRSALVPFAVNCVQCVYQLYDFWFVVSHGDHSPCWFKTNEHSTLSSRISYGDPRQFAGVGAYETIVRFLDSVISFEPVIHVWLQ